MKRKNGKTKLKELCDHTSNRSLEIVDEELVPLGKREKTEKNQYIQKLQKKPTKMGFKPLEKNAEKNGKNIEKSTFSICSWEQRPHSRVEAIPSSFVFKKANN